MGYAFDFSFLAERWPDFVAGAWLTIRLTVVSISLGFAAELPNGAFAAMSLLFGLGLTVVTRERLSVAEVWTLQLVATAACLGLFIARNYEYRFSDYRWNKSE